MDNVLIDGGQRPVVIGQRPLARMQARASPGQRAIAFDSALSSMDNAPLPIGNGMPSGVAGAWLTDNNLLSVGNVLASGGSVVHDLGNVEASACAVLWGRMKEGVWPHALQTADYFVERLHPELHQLLVVGAIVLLRPCPQDADQQLPAPQRLLPAPGIRISAFVCIRSWP
jgi:hypothetical protein